MKINLNNETLTVPKKFKGTPVEYLLSTRQYLFVLMIKLVDAQMQAEVCISTEIGK
jgi:hypothetical protein